MSKTPRKTPPGAKIRTDERGRSVWSSPVAATDFELVTTQELRAILKSTDEQSVRAIEDVAKSADEDGVLARHAETGMFQIVADAELKELLDGQPPSPRPTADVILEPTANIQEDIDGLSLVSTQTLRKIINNEPVDEDDDVPSTGGFDPYNSG